jgi:hypothetical protein
MAEPTIHHHEVAQLMERLQVASAAIAALGPRLLEFRPADDRIRSDCLTQMLAAQGHIFQIGQHLLAEQAGGGAPDPWRPKLESWLNSVLEEDMFTAEDLLTQALGAHPKLITRQDCARLGSVMQSIGWSRVRFRAPYARWAEWHYLRPGSDREGQR